MDRDRKEVDKHADSLLLDALAVAATRNTLFMLEHKIKQQEISTLKAAELIKIFIANQHSPSDRQAEILEKIAVSELAQRCPVLKQTSWLAYGAAIGKICQERPAQSQNNPFRVEEVCPESKKEQVSGRIRNRLSTAFSSERPWSSNGNKPKPFMTKSWP